MNAYRVRQGYKEAAGMTMAQIAQNGAQDHWRCWKLKRMSNPLPQMSNERDNYTRTIQPS